MSPNPRSNLWKTFPDLLKQMTKLFYDGGSFGSIAEALGHGLTRSAVGGKLHREGIKRPKKKHHNIVPPKPRPQYNISEFHPITKREEEPRFYPPPTSDMEIPLAQRKTIMTVGMDDCRFPIGDVSSPDFFFCGAPKTKDSPYCAHHAARCFTKSVPSARPYRVGRFR